MSKVLPQFDVTGIGVVMEAIEAGASGDAELRIVGFKVLFRRCR